VIGLLVLLFLGLSFRDQDNAGLIECMWNCPIFFIDFGLIEKGSMFFFFHDNSLDFGKTHHLVLGFCLLGAF
jgi:hypothetical protein